MDALFILCFLLGFVQGKMHFQILMVSILCWSFAGTFWWNWVPNFGGKIGYVCRKCEDVQEEVHC